MIKYDRLWVTMKNKGMTQYALINTYKVSRGQISRLKHNKNVNTFTLDRLCEILDCRIEDIVEYVKNTEEKTDNA